MNELLERCQAEADTVELPPGISVTIFEADHPEQGTALGVDVRMNHGDWTTGQVAIVPWNIVTDGTVRDRIELTILDLEMGDVSELLANPEDG